MKPKIKPGVGLILHGAKGSGITTLARQLAGAKGEYRHITPDDLIANFPRWLQPGIATFIVSGLPPLTMPRHRLKTLITSRWLTAERMGQLPEQVETPHFIFDSNDSAAALAIQEPWLELYEVKKP